MWYYRGILRINRKDRLSNNTFHEWYEKKEFRGHVVRGFSDLVNFFFLDDNFFGNKSSDTPRLTCMAWTDL